MSLFSNITVGQYIPGNSIVHRLDPRTKLLAMPLIVAAIMTANQPLGYLFAAIPVLLAMLTARIPLKVFWRGMRILWLILVISLILQALSYPGEEIWRWKMLSISREGLEQGAKMIFRLGLLILSTMLLTMTTTPVNLTGAMERLLAPLKKLGIPAHELAMMMTIALRFVPTLLEEAEAITKSQQARGGSIASGKFNQRLKASIALLVPLLASSLRRADELATAMEARCYRGDNGRTRLRQFKYQTIDYVVLLLLFITFIMVLANNIMYTGT